MPVSEADPPATVALTVPPEPGFIELLEAEAAREGVSGAGMARACNIDQGLWSRVRRGVAGERFGVDACARIVEHYPSLREAAARYLVERYPYMETLLEEASRIVREAEDPSP
jgi:hypothetical protein